MAMNGPQTIGTAMGAALIAIVDYRVNRVAWVSSSLHARLPVAARRSNAPTSTNSTLPNLRQPLDLRVGHEGLRFGMTTRYQIKEVSRTHGLQRSDPALLRRHRAAPPLDPHRCGYRIFDDHTLGALAFIARAKQLGCSLDEIADLTIAWEGGRCGPVQDRLRTVVADKLDVASDRSSS